MKKINFRQPKYIFPAVIFIPLCFLIYFVMQMFGGGGDDEKTVATDRINATLPEANAEAPGDKMFEMSRRFGDEDAFTAVGALGEETQEREALEHGYSDDELDRIDAAEAERMRQQQELEELERSLAESRRHINSYAYGDRYNPADHEPVADPRSEYARDLEAIQQRSYERQKAIEAGLGIGQPDPEEALRRQRADSIAKAREAEREKNRPLLVLKSRDTNAEKFNTVSGESGSADAPLIRAMIDKTTKAHEGTRLRFKLLDDVSIHDVRLPKGTYLRHRHRLRTTARPRRHNINTRGWKIPESQPVGFRQRRHGGLLCARIRLPRLYEGGRGKHRAAEHQL